MRQSGDGDVSSCPRQEEPVGGNKPVKSQGSVCGGAPNGFAGPRSSLERLCQARRARRAARKLREQQRHAPKVPSNLDILERHTREVLRRLEVGPLEEVSGAVGISSVPSGAGGGRTKMHHFVKISSTLSIDPRHVCG